MKAIRAGIAVYATHTASDKVLEGVSGIFAGKMGLQDVRILEPDADGEHGLGVIGNLPEPLSVEEIRGLLKKQCGVRAIRASRPLRTPIRTVALCGGSGGSLIETARRAAPSSTSAPTSPTTISSPRRLHADGHRPFRERNRHHGHIIYLN